VARLSSQSENAVSQWDWPKPEKTPRTEARILHGILVHGDALRDGRMTQEQFWSAIGRGKTHGQKAKATLGHLGVLRRRPGAAPDPNGEVGGEYDLAFGPKLGYVLGMSIGSESLRATLLDANGTRLLNDEDDSSYRRAKAPPSELLEDIAQLAHRVLGTALDTPSLLVREPGVQPYLPLLGVAVAWPGPMHRLTKLPTGASLHPDWETEGVSLAHRVADRLGIDRANSSALNDANAAGFSAVFDATRDGDPRVEVHRGWVALVLRLGGGVGASTFLVDKHNPKRSAFLDTRLVEGTDGMAGELGHLRLDPAVVAGMKSDTAGIAKIDLAFPCSCGRTGHLESVAGGAALAQRVLDSPALEQHGLRAGADREGPPRMHDIIASFSERKARDLLVDVGKLLGHALAGPMLMLNPHRIIITGALAHEGVKRGVLEVASAWRSSITDDPEIELLHGDDNRYSAARGAALAVLRKCVHRRIGAAFQETGYRVNLIAYRRANLPGLDRSPTTHQTTASRIDAPKSQPRTRR
jgi:predicted NBD/HSP70 family sugar kinase